MSAAPRPLVAVPTVGIQLPTVDGFGVGYQDLRRAAKLAEDLQFDSVWIGDHLTFNAPVVEAFVAGATVAAVTSRIRIGFGVLVAALRSPAWLAKQISSLQVVSGDRLELGIGVGGEFENEWKAAGVPRTERGLRTNTLLEALPDLLSGRPASLGEPWNYDVPSLLPNGSMPPLWIGGRSEHSLQRVARFAGGWMGVWMDPDRVAQCRDQLAEMRPSGARPTPIGLEILVHPSSDPRIAQPEMEGFMNQIYNVPYERLRPFTMHGKDGIAEGIEKLWAAGVTQFVLIPAARDFYSAALELADAAHQIRQFTAASPVASD